MWPETPVITAGEYTCCLTPYISGSLLADTISRHTCAANGTVDVSKCAFVCNEGYAASNRSIGTCLLDPGLIPTYVWHATNGWVPAAADAGQTASYQNQAITCTAQTCPALTAPAATENYQIKAGSCVADGVLGSGACEYECKAGYAPKAGVVKIGVCTANPHINPCCPTEGEVCRNGNPPTVGTDQYGT